MSKAFLQFGLGSCCALAVAVSAVCAQQVRGEYGLVFSTYLGRSAARV